MRIIALINESENINHEIMFRKYVTAVCVTYTFPNSGSRCIIYMYEHAMFIVFPSNRICSGNEKYIQFSLFIFIIFISPVYTCVISFRRRLSFWAIKKSTRNEFSRSIICDLNILLQNSRYDNRYTDILIDSIWKYLESTRFHSKPDGLASF